MSCLHNAPFEFSLSCHVKTYATKSGGKRFRRSFQILIALRQPDCVVKGGEIGGFQVLELCESRQGRMKNYNRIEVVNGEAMEKYKCRFNACMYKQIFVY
jgi:hypothetical protein